MAISVSLGKSVYNTTLWGCDRKRVTMKEEEVRRGIESCALCSASVSVHYHFCRCEKWWAIDLDVWLDDLVAEWCEKRKRSALLLLLFTWSNSNNLRFILVSLKIVKSEPCLRFHLPETSFRHQFLLFSLSWVLVSKKLPRRSNEGGRWREREREGI